MIFSLTVVDRGFSAALAEAANLSPADFKPEWEKLGDDLLDRIAQQFITETDPYGDPWEPLSEFTLWYKRRLGVANPEAILQERGIMAESFRVDLIPAGLSLFTDRTFPDGSNATKHQFGGPASLTPGGEIPARRLLPFNDVLPPAWFNDIVLRIGQGVDRIFA